MVAGGKSSAHVSRSNEPEAEPVAPAAVFFRVALQVLPQVVTQDVLRRHRGLLPDREGRLGGFRSVARVKNRTEARTVLGIRDRQIPEREGDLVPEANNEDSLPVLGNVGPSVNDTGTQLSCSPDPSRGYRG